MHTHIRKNVWMLPSFLSSFLPSFLPPPVILSAVKVSSSYLCQRLNSIPNQQRTLNVLSITCAAAEILSMSTNLAHKLGPNVQKTCTQCEHIPTELPFCIPPLVVRSSQLENFRMLTRISEYSVIKMLLKTRDSFSDLKKCLSGKWKKKRF